MEASNWIKAISHGLKWSNQLSSLSSALGTWATTHSTVEYGTLHLRHKCIVRSRLGSCKYRLLLCGHMRIARIGGSKLHGRLLTWLARFALTGLCSDGTTNEAPKNGRQRRRRKKKQQKFQLCVLIMEHSLAVAVAVAGLAISTPARSTDEKEPCPSFASELISMGARVRVRFFFAK